MISRIFGSSRRDHAVLILGLMGILLVLAGVLLLLPQKTATRAAGTSSDTPTYMGDLTRSGFNSGETILNTTTAHTLSKLWQLPQTGPSTIGSIDVQPVIVGGVIYWGSWDGNEHATRLDGTEIWHQFIGKTTSAIGCTPVNAGPSGTATVANVSINGGNKQVVFVPGGDAKFYALDAANGGAVLWSTALGSPPNEMLWAGSAFYNGNIYIGISSYGDCPLTPGKLFKINASTGALVTTIYPTPANNSPAGHCLGAGIWNQPAIDAAANALYITTGTVFNCNPPENQAYAILKVDLNTFAIVDSWQIPQPWNGDSDFGSTATLFQATINGTVRQLVGAVNKNGWYYALDRNNLKAGPVWQKQVSTPAPKDKSSISSSAWDGTRLYEENSNTTINGQVCGGSVRAMDPASGNFLWQYCASGRSIGGVTVTPSVVIAQSGADVVVLNAATGPDANGQPLAKYTDTTSVQSWFWGTPAVYNGVIYTGNKDGIFYALSVQGGSTTPPPSTGTPIPPTTPPGPVARTWYFAEGRVGSGFREYLTVDNPTANACTANVRYLYTVDGSPTPRTKTVTLPVAASSRATKPVNADLGISDSTTPAASVATVVTVDPSTPACTGFVVERPEYFTNYHGLSSGTDVLGSTTLGTAFNFADVPSGSGFNSYLTILNPGAATANVTVKYYASGKIVGTQTLAVPTASRGTIAPAAVTPALPTHSAAVVTSTQPILVERPAYISNVNGFSGAADVVGAQALAKDWLFAEGYAAATSQESLTLANVNIKPATVTITLKSRTGATNPVNVTVPAQSQLVWSVNANNNFSGASPEVSAEVLSTGVAAISIVVQREMYYQYSHALPNGTLQTNSVTDVLGMLASNARSSYSFSEGYTNTGYHEWLTLQNPTTNAETVWITIVNGYGRSYVQSIPVVANSRSTVDITLLVQQHLAQPGDVVGNEISMTVQTLNNGGSFVAERPVYFNTTGSAFVALGGTDVIGY